MKKFLSVLLVCAVVLSMSALLSSCGETKDTKDDETKVVDTTAAEETTEAEETTVEETTEEETTAGAITEGSIVIDDLVTIDLKDGWYSEEGLDTTWNKVKLENKSITGFLANVSVSVGKVYGDDHAKEWAENTQGNYQGKGKITEEDINGVHYYHLSGVVDDDDQNIYYADLDDEHYIEVSIMFMSVDEGKPVFDLISFN